MAQKRYDFTTQLKSVLSLAELRPTWVRLGTPVTIHTRHRDWPPLSPCHPGKEGAHNGNGRRGRGVGRDLSHLSNISVSSLLLLFLGLFIFNLSVVNLENLLVFFFVISIVILPLLFSSNYIFLLFVPILNIVPLSGILPLLLLFHLLKMFSILLSNFALKTGLLLTPLFSSILIVLLFLLDGRTPNFSFFINFLMAMFTFLLIFFISNLPHVCLSVLTILIIYLFPSLVLRHSFILLFLLHALSGTPSLLISKTAPLSLPLCTICVIILFNLLLMSLLKIISSLS